jgi:predicted GTPase
MGAAGRDFHNFNVCFRSDSRYEVVCFTATQIPGIESRIYPPELSGDLYPDGIPIYPEEGLKGIISDYHIDEVIFSYSDVSHEYVMQKASLITAMGADFRLLNAPQTMIDSNKPVISVCAVRTGCGKSQTARKVASILHSMGKKPVLVRHPMPYGELDRQIVQRFSCHNDFLFHKCTIEEREEYEPIVDNGMVVFAGSDYARILKEAEKESDVIVWDGGNNDTPFFKPNIHIVVFDPHRPDHELKYYPGTTNMIMADIAIINKVKTADEVNIKNVRNNIMEYNPLTHIVLAESGITVDDPGEIQGKRVLVVEDGPTLTHGEMEFGAGYLAARKNAALEIIDPFDFAVGSIKEVYDNYPNVGRVLPAMGYSQQQIKDLETTINRSDCDLVLFATPIDLTKIVNIDKPTLRVKYEYKDHGITKLENVLKEKLEGIKNAWNR